MSFGLEDIERVRRGGIHQVGELSDDIIRAVGWHSPHVYLSKDSLEHIAKEHDDVTDYDLLHIPLVLRAGLIVWERKDPRFLMASYFRGDVSRRYMCSIKGANNGYEIWVSTFHRMRPRQVRSMLKRGVKLRDHK